MSGKMRQVIACVGAGRMGRGIAHCFAYAGHEVRLLDAKARDAGAEAAFFAQTLDEIRGTLQIVSGLGGFDQGAIDGILERVSLFPLSRSAEALKGASVVFEAVPETEDAKRAALGLISDHAGAEAIIASTTSTFLSTQLAGWTGRPERFLNAHWLNPAFLVPLVEVSPADLTEAGVVEDMRRLLDSVGKVPVVCKTSPGYIVPRIQTLAMNEAARLVEEGIASAEDVDRAVKYGFGLRFAILGLLEFIDWGGGDILYYASDYLTKAMGSARFAAPDIVRENMAGGRNGFRDGRGFYDYAPGQVEALKRARMKEFFDALVRAGLHRPPADRAAAGKTARKTAKKTAKKTGGTA